MEDGERERMTTVSETAGAIASAEKILMVMSDELHYESRAFDPDAGMPSSWRGNVVRSVAASRLWRSQGRQVLAIHPEIQQDVASATSSKFSMEMLRSLPYANPMVVYADPISIPSWRRGSEPDPDAAPYRDEASMRLLGFMVAGQARVGSTQDVSLDAALRAVSDSVVLSNDPDTEHLLLLAFAEVLDIKGNRIDYETASMSLPLVGKLSFEELVQQQLHRFRFTKGGSHQQRLVWVEQVYRNLLGTMLYLVSTVLDVERVPTRATRHLTGPACRKPPQMHRVGWKLGAALSRYRRDVARTKGEKTGVQQAPQHRKAHFRTQWYGSRKSPACMQMKGTCDCPGRHREWVFISSYWTRRELLSEDRTYTLHRVS